MRFVMIATLVLTGCSGSTAVDGFGTTSEMLAVHLSDETVSGCVDQASTSGGAPFGTRRRLKRATTEIGAGIASVTLGVSEGGSCEAMTGGTLIWQTALSVTRDFVGGPVFREGDVVQFIAEREPCEDEDMSCAFEPSSAVIELRLIDP